MKTSYLNVEPMVVALRSRPGDFEMNHGWLHHFPSNHRFKISKKGKVRLSARCDCARLAVQEYQGLALRDAFEEWYSIFWRPIEINREFSAHFDPPSLRARILRGCARRLRRLLDRYDPAEEEIAESPSPLVAAE